jgi:hypothetical protein
MKRHGRVEVCLHTFLTSSPDGDCFNAKERAFGAQCQWISREEKLPHLCGEVNYNSTAFQPVL